MKTIALIQLNPNTEKYELSLNKNYTLEQLLNIILDINK